MTGRLSQGAADVADAASRVAGTVAARGRGDIDGARALLASFDSHEELASGALLVAELALHALSEANGEPLDDCVEILTLKLSSMRS